jgi:hypothetical protein
MAWQNKRWMAKKGKDCFDDGIPLSARISLARRRALS